MVIVALVWMPDPLRLPAGASMAELLEAATRYRAAAFDAPLMSTARLLSYYSIGWLCVMLTIALKVVVRLQIAGTMGAGAFLTMLLGGLTLLVGQ